MTATWTNPQPQDGDRYLWGVVRAGADTRLELVDDTQVTVEVATGSPAGTTAAAERTCVEVSIVRADRRASNRPALGCTP
ncbi:hypothetical protein [Cellulomonas sp. ATA003]|uniref:hypothetical protein n=1 Tax=Cellulomonas sp. ATA003 TaxID=3073064 RepID=UPI002873C2C1|nr:hypothetical protein [Cellulomonas sp. ATA003]WNB85964.1 hypothetical protein REH70_01225 [Cellulomonas sp. ATA003]